MAVAPGHAGGDPLSIPRHRARWQPRSASIGYPSNGQPPGEIMRIVITILAALTAVVTAAGTASAAVQCKPRPVLPYVLMLTQFNGAASAYQRPATLNVELDAPSYPPSRVLRDLHWAHWTAVSAAGTGVLWVEGNSGLGPPPAPTLHCSAVVDLRWRHCSVGVILQDPENDSQAHLRFFSQLLISSRLSEGVAGGGQYDWEWQPHGWVQVQGA